MASCNCSGPLFNAPCDSWCTSQADSEQPAIDDIVEVVDGSEVYQVHRYDRWCTCAAFRENKRGLCKHILSL